MSKGDLLLAIDCGTQSLKAMALDGQGSLQGLVRIPFDPPFRSQRPGWAEQDPLLYWDSLCRATNGLFSGVGVPRERIAGVSLTSQRGTVVNLDRRGNPLRPAILWLDQRKASRVDPIGGWWGLLFKLAGLSGTVTYIQKEAEANWVLANEPEIWRNTHKYLLLSGYLHFKLTDLFVDSVGCQVGYIPFDYKRLRWARSWDWKWKLPIRPEMLPELVPPGRQLGEISQRAAAETRIPAGTPVIAAAADKACEVLGSGGMSPSVGCISYGTTATINVTHHKYLEPIALIPAYPAAIPGSHSLEVQIFRGYWMVSWFKRELGQAEQARARELGREAEALLEELASEVPPGSLGLVLQPYWTPGIRMPGPEARGCIVGFGDSHSKGHIYRSILEGIGYALREGKERIEAKTKIPIRELRVSGGGSRSQLAMQITADIFGLPASRPHLWEASGLGAAICCSVGLGFFSSYQEAMNSMTRIQERFEPNPDNHELYSSLYCRVYRKLYSRLEPLYRELQQITGYPPR